MVAGFELFLAEGHSIVVYGPLQVFDRPRHLEGVELDTCFQLEGAHRAKATLIKLGSYLHIAAALRRRRNAVIIAVDPPGLVAARQVHRLLRSRVCLVYWSFEIMFGPELTGRLAVLKRREQRATRAVQLLVIQDEVRERLLRSESRFRPGTRAIRLPVAPQDVEHLLPRDLHSELGIPPGRSIALFSGTVAEWSGIDGLLDVFESNWDDRWWLVVHSRFGDDDSPLTRRLRHLVRDGRPLTLHDSFLDAADLPGFVAGADATLCFYIPIPGEPLLGANISNIGLASGKFALSMMTGTPCVTTFDPMFDQLHQDHPFGAIVTDIAEVPRALGSMSDDLESRGLAARRTYEVVLDPTKGLESLARAVDEMGRR